MTKESIPQQVNLDYPFGWLDGFRDYSWYTNGFDAKDTIPSAAGGTQITRHKLNGLGYIATLGTILARYRYPDNKYDADIQTRINGYPEGAIVHKVTDEGYLVECESKKDDNLDEFPAVVNGMVQETDSWRPITSPSSIFGVPNTSSAKTPTQRWSNFVADSSSGIVLRYEIYVDSQCWLNIKREIDNYDSLPYNAFIYGYPVIKIQQSDKKGNPVTLGELGIDGGKVAETTLLVDGGKVECICENYNDEIYGKLSMSAVAFGLYT